MSDTGEKTPDGKENDGSFESLRSFRKASKPSRKKVENDVASVYQDLNKVYRILRKYWVHLDDLHEEGDFETLKSQQTEFEIYCKEFSELIIKFKELRNLDSWNIFSFPPYSEFLVTESFIENANMKALMLPLSSATPDRPIQSERQRLNVDGISVSTSRSHNARLLAKLAPSEGSPIQRANLNDSVHSTNGGKFTRSKVSPRTKRLEDVEGVQDLSNSCQNNQAINMQNSFLKEIFLRQHLPKVVPDVFAGEPTRFHAWKSSFEAMIQGTNLSPQQEMVYLLQYTSGKVKILVEAFRNRRLDPSQCLSQLWTELRRRFGSPATVANSYLERLTKSAGFKEGDRVGLQSFADLCEDVESQMDVLSALSCLNFPASASLIYVRLPDPVKRKWNKIILKYADEHDDDFPKFNNFVEFITGLARLENHPNVLCCIEKKSRPQVNAYKTEKGDSDHPIPGSSNAVGKFETCPFHKNSVHALHDCRTFQRMEFAAKNDFLKERRLCFRCLKYSTHTASACKVYVNCGICNSDGHWSVLHRDKAISNNLTVTDQPLSSASNSEDEQEALDAQLLRTNCLAVCRDARRKGSKNCSRIVLGDVYLAGSSLPPKRAYCILDEQANSSLVSTSLADNFGADLDKQRYLLSTCGAKPQEVWGRHLTGLVFRGVNGVSMELPLLTECSRIPQSKREIALPHLVDHHQHLSHLVPSLPEYESDTDIHILLGRDAPEILKVRDVINGPPGAPWAQKSVFGWSV